MSGCVLCLSPHHDDLAYSLAGRLLCGREGGSCLLAVAIFTHTPFAPYASPGLDCATITRLRQEEDEAFCATLGLSRLDLHLNEAPLRGYHTTEDLFVTLSCAQDDPVLADLRQAFRQLAREYHPVRVYAPLGVAGHVDHLLTRQAAIDAFAADSQLLFYEDLPYAGELAPPELQATLAQLAAGLVAEITPAGTWLPDKLRLLSGYASQVAPKDLNSVIVHTQLTGGERVWI